MFRTDGDREAMPATALLVNLDPDTSEGVTTRKLFEEAAIRTVDVGPASFDRTVADLLGSDRLPAPDPDKIIPNQEEPDGSEVPDDVQMIVMASFTRKQLQDFMENYRRSSAPPIRLKAMATHNNLHWKLRSLAAELELEHQTMSLYNVLVRGVKAVELMDANEYTDDSWQALEKAAVHAAEQVNKLRNQTNVPVPTLRDAWLSLQEAVNGLRPDVTGHSDE